MTGRERFLTALNKGRPDRLPCAVHSWMERYLRVYLDGRSPMEAYRYFAMDPVAYAGPEFRYGEADSANWQVKVFDLGTDKDGVCRWREEITTPKGKMFRTYARNDYTQWETEHLIKNERDFELFEKFMPWPVGADGGPVLRAREEVGEAGIVRNWANGYGQGSPWQDLCVLMGTESAIMAAMDRSEWVHACLQAILARRLRFIELMRGCGTDLTETGGGAGSSTVIGPALFREFCLPYDIIQNRALHEAGLRVVYHLCGGVMPMLELVVQTGADGLETMTPPGMGGDCDLAEAARRVGGKLFFVGGFDQRAGFEKGTPKTVREQVTALFRACPDGGYICCPSDHFFDGDPENVRAFADACRECRY
jgi:uroporphyrinogen decarboxylase